MARCAVFVAKRAATGGPVPSPQANVVPSAVVKVTHPFWMKDCSKMRKRLFMAADLNTVVYEIRLKRGRQARTGRQFLLKLT